MSLPTSDSLFMCVAVAHESPGKSFEELRIEDYIRFYSTTGRPPPPCPQEPTDEALRTRSSLPPLFKPYSERSLTSAVARPSDLPEAQNFFTTTHEGEILHSMSAIPTYEAFSHEELRYHAYLKGHRLPPTPVQMAPFVIAPTPTNPSLAMGTRLLDTVSGVGEQLMTISTQAAFAGHSLEELRIAFMQNGRELNSSEILARIPRPSSLTPTPVTSTAASSGGGGGLFSRPPTVRLF